MDFTEVSAQPASILSSVGSKDPVILSSNASLISTGSADSDVSDKKRKEKIAEFKKNEKDLQEKLKQKIQELKRICLREAELTGRIPKEYPYDAEEMVPEVARCVRAPFRRKDPSDKDPLFRDLESTFALQQKIVESSKRIVSEGDLYKTLKSKRRYDYMNAGRNQEEKPGNGLKITKGRKPSQVVSLMSTDEVDSSELSSPSLSLDDNSDLGSQREQFGTVQYSTVLHHAKTLQIPQMKDRQAAAHDQLAVSRLNQSNCKSLHHCQIDARPSSSSRSRPSSRHLYDSHITPPTLLPSYCSTQLRLEKTSHPVRQRSGSLESLSQMTMESKSPPPSFGVFPAQRSSSTEVLDDVSSYTSQSSVEYNAPASSAHRRGHRKDIYNNTGSMPNLLESESLWYQNPPHTQCPTAYYVTGYPRYRKPEPYSPYGESERYCSYYPHYHATQGPHHSDSMHSHYASNDTDGVTYNTYGSLGPAGNHPPFPSSMQPSKSFQKALVAEHLKGWFQRNATQRPGAHYYDYDRVSQQSLRSQHSAVVYAQNNRNTPCSSVSLSSNGNWNAYRSDGPSLDQLNSSYFYNAGSSSLSNHSRSYRDVNPLESHSSQMHSSSAQGEQICWHEDSEPGTIV
ncbi:FERM domain-containing protein 4B isoform X2 [Oryzias melastigma]|uniref:FERM domain-containing protein 4B isoform X2 n=1 Tax=Oryzias melastigma TaxID=30732 RepID=UPI000CF7C80E|nr:FERM domain-containing protein 4B isoform X2 [Oryzias melastigma]